MPLGSEVISIGCCRRQPQARQLLINWLCEYLSTSLTFIIANLSEKINKSKKKGNVHLCLPLHISCLPCFPSGPPIPRSYFRLPPSNCNQSSSQLLLYNALTCMLNCREDCLSPGATKLPCFSVHDDNRHLSLVNISKK